MKTSNNTILITGGSAGIGLALAQTLLAAGNKVIITGRNAARLAQAKAQLGNVTTIVSDVSREADIQQLAQRIAAEFPGLNMVINNAGSAYIHHYQPGDGISVKAREEIQTNYLSIIALNDQLMPLLEKQAEAAIVNVSSIVSFVPSVSLPTYSASKAALHSYSQSLRFHLRNTSIRVFELMPPLVNTDFSQDIGGAKGIPPAAVAEQFMAAWQADAYEVHVGQTADMYQLSRSAPAEAFAALNAGRDI